jgi:hypothetical protein
MNENKDYVMMKSALDELLTKYRIQPINPYTFTDPSADELSLCRGWTFEKPLSQTDVPLLPWRVKRKFVELVTLVRNQTIENVRMLRFACFTNPSHRSLQDLIYTELDLCEYLGCGQIISIFATIQQEKTANIIVGLNNTVTASLELSVQMDGDNPPIQRHELIAERGIASDMVVDTQIPQQSLYLFSEQDRTHYTDTDFELYGFEEDQIDQIRAGFAVLSNPSLINEWKHQHDRLVNLVQCTLDSDKTGCRIDCEVN